MKHTFIVQEVDGVLITENTGAPKYSQELFSYERILTLKQDPDQPESLLNNPTSFTMDEAGCFYVEDYSDRRIVMYDQLGGFVRSIGQKGDGPGEFATGWKLLDLQGDVLTVFNRRTGRNTKYRTNGTLLDVITLPKVGSFIVAQYQIPEGYIFLNRSFEVRGKLRYECFHFTTYTSELDTVGTAKTSELPTMFQSLVPLPSGDVTPSWLSIPFAPTSEAQYIAGKGVLLTSATEPVLCWYHLNGQPNQRITLDIPIYPLTEDEKITYLQRIDRSIEEMNGLNRANMENARDALVFPETKGYWSSVFVDNFGYIWLMIPEPPADQDAKGGYAFHVLNPDGEYLGITRSPEQGRVVRGHLLVFVTDPDTDEIVPTIWRLIPHVAGFTYP